MKGIIFHIGLGSFFGVMALVGFTQIPTVDKASYKNVQFITSQSEFYDDGAVLPLYAACKITSPEGNHIMDVPESLNNPHIVQLRPGKYIIEVETNGEVEKFAVEVDESSFQQFSLQ